MFLFVQLVQLVPVVLSVLANESSVRPDPSVLGMTLWLMRQPVGV
ncbi:hypothetical protein [Acidovorax radicis]|nr:hypothetical protein [Acidovorax radicis]